VTETEQWDEVMSKAREYGFLTTAAGGTAVLVTRENQLKHYGREEYERIQKMNDREV
jgi:hypothetical protein